MGGAGDLDGEEFDAIGRVREGPGASFGVVDAELFPRGDVLVSGSARGGFFPLAASLDTTFFW